jgi:hypothetical protein
VWEYLATGRSDRELRGLEGRLDAPLEPFTRPLRAGAPRTPTPVDTSTPGENVGGLMRMMRTGRVD